MEGSCVPMILSSLYDCIASLCLCGVTIPDSDYCGEDALDQSPVGLGERVMVQTSFPEQTDKIKHLLGFFHCG